MPAVTRGQASPQTAIDVLCLLSVWKCDHGTSTSAIYVAVHRGDTLCILRSLCVTHLFLTMVVTERSVIPYDAVFAISVVERRQPSTTDIEYSVL